MNPTTHEIYVNKVDTYTRLVHGTDQNGLIVKLQIYRSFLDKHREQGDRLWKIDPLLFYLIKSLEQDVHITLAKFFENDGYGFQKFLRFCLSNRRQIRWSSGAAPSEEILLGHQVLLDQHEPVIASIRGRRNKFFAHSDKKYRENPEKLYSDFPLSETEVVDLAQTLISVVHEHEVGLTPKKWSFHVAEFFEISVDNMVRNLEAGRKLNFPDHQLD